MHAKLTTDCDDCPGHSICDLREQISDAERRLATHIVGSIAVGTLILLGCMLGLTSVLLQHG